MNVLARIGHRVARHFGAAQDGPVEAELRLHLGVHKTATTHLQTSIQAARSELAATGLCYLGPSDIRQGRSGLLGLLQGESVSVSRARFRQATQSAPCVLVSDENLIGTMEDNFLADTDVPGIYRSAAARVEALVDGLGAPPAHLFIGLRDPASYYDSCYRFHLKQREFMTWTDYSARRALRDVSWVPMIRALSALPCVAQITLWRCEDYPDIGPEILRAMLGAPWADLPLAEARANPGLSDRQVARRYAQAQVRPDFVGNRFTAFGPDGQRRSANRYKRELRRLSGLGGVTLLSPGKP